MKKINLKSILKKTFKKKKIKEKNILKKVRVKPNKTVVRKVGRPKIVKKENSK